MSAEQRHLTLLERLDVALASRVALRSDGADAGRPEDLRFEPLRPDADADGQWIARVLGLRGYEVHTDEAISILRHGLDQPVRADQETHMMCGLARALDLMRERARSGKAPDGWFAVELFRRFTDGIARFRRNAIRRDEPWDGITTLQYPPADELPALLEEFCEARGYGEIDGGFDEQHPVRQAVRVLWGFARIAPFPDFNVVMAFVLMDAYLMAKGYPMITPLNADRQLLAQVVAGPRPQRVVQFESRLLERAEG